MKISNIIFPVLVLSASALSAQQQNLGMGSSRIHILFPFNGTGIHNNAYDTSGNNYVVKHIDCWITPIHTLNSDFPEYTPIIAHDVHTMFFTGRRNDNVGNKRTIDKHKAEDIFYSIKDAQGSWGEEIPVPGNINSSKNEAITWISSDGKKMILCQNEDMYESVFTNGEWSTPEPMKAINSAYRETHASYSPDGNIIFFTTDNPDYAGIGGMDICMIKRDNSSGVWGKPELIESINSPLNEEDPTLLNDGKTFYFSSQGFSSLGGYDIFKSSFEKGNFSAPENIGFPINTTSNEPFISFSEDGSRAFLSSDRGDKNEQNIYEVIFPEHLKLPLLVEVYDADTKELLNSNVTLAGAGNESIYLDNASRGVFSTGGLTMNSLYTLNIESKDHDTLQLTINTKDLGPFDPDTFRLVKKVYLHTQKNETPLLDESVNHKVYFDYSKSTLTPQSLSILEQVKTFLDNHPDAYMVISGHTDHIGSVESNYILSDKRSKSVVKWLVKHGIDPAKIVMTSHGEEKPFTDNSTEDNRSKNRRVEIDITFKK